MITLEALLAATLHTAASISAPYLPSHGFRNTPINSGFFKISGLNSALTVFAPTISAEGYGREVKFATLRAISVFNHCHS